MTDAARVQRFIANGLAAQQAADVAQAEHAIAAAAAALERLAGEDLDPVEPAELERAQARIAGVVDVVAHARTQLAQLHARVTRRLAQLRAERALE